MKNLDTIKKLVGKEVTAEDLRYVDCYVSKHMGLFIPSIGQCQFAITPKHIHPSYMFIICFEKNPALIQEVIPVPENHYLCAALSPDIPHEESTLEFVHYYCVMIEKEYFESQFQLYNQELPHLKMKQFLLCHDILKTLNGFAFEYTKEMPNAEITLEAQATIITHWLIRSLLGANYDMRAISTDYSIARAEHYIEQHFAETITVTRLAQLGQCSVSHFRQKFKKELGITPKEYLIQVRIEKAKKMLRRNEKSITEIALACGFNSSAHFTSCFTTLTGITPTAYKSTYKES